MQMLNIKRMHIPLYEFKQMNDSCNSIPYDSLRPILLDTLLYSRNTFYLACYYIQETRQVERDGGNYYKVSKYFSFTNKISLSNSQIFIINKKR